MKFQLPLFILITALLLGSVWAGDSSADIVRFRATGSEGDGLLDGNISPPTGESGTGGIGSTGITFNTNTGILHVDVHWGSDNGFVDLSADVFKLHLHGPTPDAGINAFGQTAPLLITLSASGSLDPSRTGGGVNDNFFVDTGDRQALLDGRTYINVHLSDTDTGVIRGYLLAVPEPSSVSLLLIFAISCLATHREPYSSRKNVSLSNPVIPNH